MDTGPESDSRYQTGDKLSSQQHSPVQPEERHVEQQWLLIVIYAHNSSINNNSINNNIILNNSKREYQIVSPLKRIVKTRLIIVSESFWEYFEYSVNTFFPLKTFFHSSCS